MKIPLGAAIWFWGGGLAQLVGEDYSFSSRARPENLFQSKPGGQNIYFQPQQIFEKAKKKKRGGG